MWVDPLSFLTSGGQMELFSKTSLAVGSTDDVPGCDDTPKKKGTRGKQAKARQKKEVGLGFWVLG